MNTLIVLLGIVATAIAVPAHFPHGKVATYKYTVDVKAGAMQPDEFGSKFGMECVMKVVHSSDPTLRNAYYVVMSDVKHGLYNGHMKHFQHINNMHPIADVAKHIQNPFLMVYDENGHLQGIKVVPNESHWSVNIKKAIASALQLNLVNIQVQSPVTPHSFISHENTIHGDCQVAYTVHPKHMDDPTSHNVFMVTKMHEPENCTHFSHHVHNHVEHEKCHMPEENGMTTASRRVFEVEDQGNAILIRKLVSHGVINYMPFHANADAHYILTNQTFVLESVVPESNVQLRSVNFYNVPIIHNFTFSKPEMEYAHEAGVDVTHGRHVVVQDQVVLKVKNMLSEAADYLKENQIKEKSADWKHGQTINRIMHVMNFMNVVSFEHVYNELKDAKDSKEITMKNIFLGIVPNVGTTASCLFTRNVIQRKIVPDHKAIMMLAVLPMHVKHPSHELLSQMEILLHLSDPVSLEVRKASILSFATLIHRTFMHEHDEVNDPLLNRCLDHFMDHIEAEPTMEMKTVYMMAMKNVGLKNILRRLEPIIKHDSLPSVGVQIRGQAIWAINKVVADHPNYAHNLLWPVLANTTAPVAIRIIAYDVLMHQFPHTARMMNMYWFMVYEKNEHLYNYHVSTLKGIANSVDPCLTPAREMAKKILRFTKIRHVPGPLSSKLHFDYVDEKFGYGEAVKVSMILNELSGLPEVGGIEHFMTVARKPSNKWGIHWNAVGLSDIIKDVKKEVLGKTVHTVTNEKVRSMLIEAAKDVPSSKHVDINIVLTLNNHVVMTFHAGKDNWKNMLSKLKDWKNLINNHLDNVNLEHVFYDDYFEMQVPTDCGLPTVLFTKMPSFDSLKIHAVVTKQNNVENLKLQMKYTGWKHGEYALSVYNPIADTWHSVRKTSVLDVLVPIDITIAYSPDTKSVKVTLPRLPATEFSVAGMSASAKSFVTVTDDETNALKNSCPECHHYAVITNNVDKKVYKNSIDSKDMGLQFNMVTYHCENNLTPVMPMSELLQVVLSNKHMNTMDSVLVQAIMTARQKVINSMISSHDAVCSNMIKIEPSIVYPTLAVDLTGKISVQDYDDEVMHFLNSKRIDIRGSMSAKAASTNEAVRQWDANLNIIMNQGHVNNTVKAIITRHGRGEKALKICVDGQKDYPVIQSDILEVDMIKKETNTKVKISMGETEEEKCVHDDLDLTVLIKGELSEEQRKHMQNDRINGTCMKHIQQSLLNPEGTHIPKTSECVHEAILHSTLRKYMVEIISKKAHLPAVVRLLQDAASIVSGHQIDSRSMNVKLEYPILSSALDLVVVTPKNEHHLVQLPWGHPVWNMWMDNTHFALPSLYKFVNSYTKLCTMYPRVMMTFDNGTIPFVVPEEWTLLVGDHVDHSFAIHAKLVKNSKIDVKIFVGEHEMEIANTDSGVVVTVDKKVVNNHEKGVMVPENQPDSYAMKLTKNYKHLILQSQQIPMIVFHTPNSIAVVLDTEFQGQLSGMCGHMDGSYHSHAVLPQVHTASHL
ncbi:larval-specific very high density lipoprotein [Megachile rotundata]|uniref:larval-specific very high density lipoprotein n=1 Tax=Megachile rotundata TaxID=143995 RepID=UPI003FD6043C